MTDVIRKSRSDRNLMTSDIDKVDVVKNVIRWICLERDTDGTLRQGDVIGVV